MIKCPNCSFTCSRHTTAIFTFFHSKVSFSFSSLVSIYS
nr:MAG TPA: alpha-aminoadipate carrier protein [Crassvirales sp.]